MELRVHLPSPIPTIDQGVSEMQQQMGKTDEKIYNVEDERDSELHDLKEMKRMADDANRKLKSELDSAKESLRKTAMDVKERETAMDKVKELELQLEEKSSGLTKLREELSEFKRSESHAKALFSESKMRIEELEKKYRNSIASEEKTKDLLAEQTRQLEQTKISLEESNLEIKTLHEKLTKLGICSSDSHYHHHLEDEVPMNQEFESLKSELESTKQQLGLLKNELKLATEAEDNNKKAMDDLAMALKEVATEANHLKGKYITSEAELKQAKEEAESLKTTWKNFEEKYKSLLNEARREADLYKSTVERLRLEAEESLLAWSGRETSLVDCIRRAEDDRFTAQQENRRLMDALRLAELKTVASKEEIKKLRDILKQALNEATVAKEAAGIAIEENSQLKDCLTEKENALDFLGSENESLKVSQAASQEEIKELKRLLEEASKKEASKEENKNKEEHKGKEENKSKEESKDQVEVKAKPPLSPSPNTHSAPVEKEETFGKRLGKAFSFSFMELRLTSEKKKEVEEEKEQEEPAIDETLKGSIFDEDVDSPVSARIHRRKRSMQFVEDGETMNVENEDLDQLEDDLEGDRNSRKKKALIRRFGDLLMRRRSFQRKELSPE